MNSKNKKTLSPLGFDPDLSGPVGAVSNRTGLARLINSNYTLHNFYLFHVLFLSIG